MEAYNSDSGENDFDMDNESDEIAVDDKEDTVNNWINWFCTLEGHEYMVDIDPEFISDPFNLVGFEK